MHPFGTPLIVADPVGGAAGAQTLPRLRAALRGRGIDHDVLVAADRDGIRPIAREAVEQGRRYLVAVGDDRTVHEVVNGMVDPEAGIARSDDPVLAVVPGARGCDFVRTFGLDRPVETVAGHLGTDASMPIDLGRAHTSGKDGTTATCVFANLAQIGLGAELLAARGRLPRRAGRAGDAAAALYAGARSRLTSTTVSVDGGSRREPVSNVLVANGQFFGAGLHVAPRALPSDGRFNVQSWIGSTGEVLRMCPLLSLGSHLERDDVREWQSAIVEVHGDRPLRVEADGRLLGVTPATFDVLSGVLRLKT